MSENTMTSSKAKFGYNITGKAPKPLGSYSHAVKAGGFLFVAGQGARNADTGEEAGVTTDSHGTILSYDIEVQTEAVIENLKVVLKEAGLSMEDLVDVTVFLADMKDFGKYNKVYEKHFSFPHPPARTTVEVARLPGKNFIEIKATAVYPVE
jgi:reactive intermediate/imine deaminase